MMKYSRLYPVITCLALGPWVLLAGQKSFWESKPYTEWSEKDVDKLLKDSPWARSILLNTGPEGPSATGGKKGGSGDDSMSSAGGSSVPRPTSRLSVTWVARPVREAMARRLILTDPEVAEDRINRLLNPNSQFFSLLVTGWTLGRQPDREAAIARFRKETMLVKKNREAILLADVVLPQKANDPLYLRFAREVDGKPALTPADQEVTLIILVGEDSYRIRFKLGDMVINGKLEL
jgi:hypothetical protein